MKWSLAKSVRNTLLALSVGVLLPSIASACSLTPSEKTKGNGTSGGVWLFIPDAPDSLMKSATLLGSIPFGDDALDIFTDHHSHFVLAWNDRDDDKRISVGSVTSGTPATDPVTPTSTTPEPSSLALLGLGTMALGLAFAGRRLRPTTVG